MSYFDDASLVMIPSGYKTSKVYSVKPTDGSGDLAFTRSNDTATRVGPDGLIEKVRTNTFVQSQALATSWSVYAVSGAGTIVRTNNYAAAPDGTTTATRIQNTGTSNTQWVYQNLASSPSVVSIYAKRTGATNQTFRLFGNNGNTQSATFTATDTWQRFTFALGSHIALPVGINADASGSAYDILFWGAQLEDGDVATAYIPTTTAAVSVGPVANVPRLDYLNSSCPRLLLEPQRSNLALNSESFDNATWTKTNVTITANNLISPDGTQNADLANFTSGTNSINTSNSFAGNGSVTISTFVKIGTISIFRIRESFYTGVSCVFDLSAQTTGAGGKIDNYGNGWYRCSFTYSLGVGQTNINWIFDSNTAIGSLYLWGAQAEVGAYVTSYIPTLGASVTRGADAASKTGISSLIGSTAGTIFFEGVYNTVNTTNTRFVSLKGAGTTYQNLMIFQDNQNGTLNVQFVDASVTATVNITWTHGLTNGQSFKVAIAYANNDVIVYQNGLSKGTDTSYTPLTFTDFYLQYTDTLGETETKQALLFKTRLSNSDLAALTA